MKRIKILSLLFVAALLVQNADAALTYLPYSSHYQGTSYFSYSSGINGRVEFAVYDTAGPYGNEWSGPTGFAVPGAGRYIYAYQIFNDVGSVPIEYFKMWADDYHVMTVDGQGAQDPQEADYLFGLDFIEPTDSGLNNTGDQAWWEFDGGLLVAGEDSWFLIFSSAHNWVAGNYSMEPVNDDVPFPNPEPCTLALLGLGSTILFAKRKKSYRVHSNN
ncbi:MAG: PEP-CTERM sorting domain-containing protein [Phycisphaerae bacterium]|nr:PEP-CTERM sorting domain-containing protein [Phycisphaerae bacterium]MDD5380655.1 PEP-CTERM sorting domain-containing protein [Phycisphaerae bacterium]